MDTTLGEKGIGRKLQMYVKEKQPFPLIGKKTCLDNRKET